MISHTAQRGVGAKRGGVWAQLPLLAFADEHIRAAPGGPLPVAPPTAPPCTPLHHHPHIHTTPCLLFTRILTCLVGCIHVYPALDAQTSQWCGAGTLLHCGMNHRSSTTGALTQVLEEGCVLGVSFSKTPVVYPCVKLTLVHPMSP